MNKKLKIKQELLVMKKLYIKLNYSELSRIYKIQIYIKRAQK